MTYAYRLEDLLSLLETKTPGSAAKLGANFRRVEDGLLSVGLKIHCLDNGEKFKDLIEGLGGASRILEVNYFKDARASLCLVLPPVGSATSAIHLIQCIEQYIGSPVFANRQIQLQLCSPGRLSPRASALLGIAFYLGSDTLRRYTQADLRTTFESSFNVAQGSMKSAEAQVQIARNALKDAIATAPLNGIVAKRHVQPGEKVAFDSPLVTIVDLRDLELQAMVPAVDVPELSIGKGVELTIDGFG